MRKFNLVASYNSPDNNFITENLMPQKEDSLEKDQKIRELEKALQSEKNKAAKQYNNLNQKKEKK